MKHINLKTILMPLFFLIGSYLVVSFYYLTIDFSEWNKYARLILGVLSVIILMISQLESSTDDKKTNSTNEWIENTGKIPDCSLVHVRYENDIDWKIEPSQAKWGLSEENKVISYMIKKA